MSGYASEPELMKPTWKPKTFGPFDMQGSDYKLRNRLFDNKFSSPEERYSAVTRLCEVAVMSGNVGLRAELAILGGIPTTRVDFFKGAIAVDFVRVELDYEAESELIDITDQALANGDIETATLIGASIGLYPLPDFWERINPFYLINYGFSAEELHQPINS